MSNESISLKNNKFESSFQSNDFYLQKHFFNLVTGQLDTQVIMLSSKATFRMYSEKITILNFLIKGLKCYLCKISSFVTIDGWEHTNYELAIKCVLRILPIKSPGNIRRSLFLHQVLTSETQKVMLYTFLYFLTCIFSLYLKAHLF